MFWIGSIKNKKIIYYKIIDQWTGSLVVISLLINLLLNEKLTNHVQINGSYEKTIIEYDLREETISETICIIKKRNLSILC